MSLRNSEEIQAAHDLLQDLVLGRLPDPYASDHDRDMVSMAMHVLCWVLGHDDNPKFKNVLSSLQRFIAKHRIPVALSERVQ